MMNMVLFQKNLHKRWKGNNIDMRLLGFFDLKESLMLVVFVCRKWATLAWAQAFEHKI
jgi:hypothetical protein